MRGAIIGDIVGSIDEFDNYRAKDFEFFGRKAAVNPSQSEAFMGERSPMIHGCREIS